MVTNKTLKSRLATITPFVLAVMMVCVLFLNIPSSDSVNRYIVPALVYLFLTAFVLFFGVWLSEGELSPAHVIGMVAFLSSPEAARPVVLWAVFLGGVVGVFGMYLRGKGGKHIPRLQPGSFISAQVFITSRVTLSFFVASQVYLITAAPLPLKEAVWADNSGRIITLLLYALVYITVYSIIFVLEIYANNQPIPQILRTNLRLMLVILLLPMPFAILTAEAVSDIGTVSEVFNLLALVIITFGLHALSRSEHKLRKQVDELQTISIVTRAVRSHLELDTLLRTIYLQIAHLLDIEGFTVALLNLDKNRLEYPLVVRRGREEKGEHELLTRLYHNSLIDHVLQTGSSLLISNNVRDTASAMQLDVPSEMFHSWVGVPLLAGGHALGVIAVHSESAERYLDQDDLRLLSIVVASASIAIENAQLYAQQTERVEQMATLNNIAALLSGTLSPDTVLDTIISSASTISEANAVAVYLFWDEAEENLPLVRSAGLSSAFTSTPPAPILRNDDKLHAKLPLAVTDVHRDNRTAHLSRLMQEEAKAAFVELPLAIGEKSLGILTLYYNDRQSFSGERLEVLRTFATQAAQAINNARTYATTDEAFQRSVEQLFALADIGRLLTSTIDLRKICELVLFKAAEATRVQIGLVMLYDDGGKLLRVLSHTGYPSATFPHDEVIQQQRVQQGMMNGKARRINDVNKAEEAYLRLVDFTRSQLIVPISRGKSVLGYIMLESRDLGAFSAEDVNFVSQIANQAVIAIDNARLFDRITEARDRLQVILDTMDEGIILVDNQGIIALANPRIQMIGLNPDAVLNRPVLDLLEDAPLKLAEQLGFSSHKELKKLTHSLTGAGSNTMDGWIDYEPHLFTAHKEQGTRYIQRFVIPVPDENGLIMGALLVFYDKTEEQELDRAREELSRMIVHDLRSPLTAVTTSMKLLTEFVPKDADFYPMVESATKASRRAIRKLLSRVDSLLDIAKMQSGRLAIDTELTLLAPLVQNTIDELMPLASELEIELLAEIAPDVPVVNVDADKVERLLLNLVDNALKYSPMESAISIHVYQEPDLGAAVRVDVIDNGPGVPDEYKDSLFDSFVQVQGRQKIRRGVGLGLSFCKLVTEAHGGKIWVEDNPDGGSIFSFILPAVVMGRLPEDTDEFFIED